MKSISSVVESLIKEKPYLEEALAHSYEAVKGITFEHCHYRTDIGKIR